MQGFAVMLLLAHFNRHTGSATSAAKTSSGHASRASTAPVPSSAAWLVRKAKRSYRATMTFPTLFRYFSRYYLCLYIYLYSKLFAYNP